MYMKMSECSKALWYLEKEFEIYQNISNRLKLAYSYQRISFTYCMLEGHLKALLLGECSIDTAGCG